MPVAAALVVALMPPRADTTRSLRRCEPLTNAEDVRGKVVLVWRGGCAFTQKAHEVEAAGGRAVVVVNSKDVLLTMAEGEILDLGARKAAKQEQVPWWALPSIRANYSELRW